MAIDLTIEMRRTLAKTVSRADEAYQAGEDETAATYYEKAYDVALRLSQRSQRRQDEAEFKKKALKYREFARRLRDGEVPAPEEKKSSSSSTSSTSSSASSSSSSSSGSPPRRGGGRGSSGKAREGEEEKGEINKVVNELIHASSLTWQDIGGLEATKEEIKYALAVSIAKKPEGVDLQTWRNMLFYGPPGTGKTLLAAATSNALKLHDGGQRAVFFNCKVSSVMSKYFGESTKIISELYGTARDASPAVIFLDEFESICGSRDDGDSGTERRILSTILSELDGLAEKGRKDVYVLTIAATNRPWDLDAAVLSRFDKKILIPLPDPVTRRAILDILLGKKGFDIECELDELVDMTDGYSGREIDRFCKEVTNRMVAECNLDLPGLVDSGLEKVQSYEIKVRPLRLVDFEEARVGIHPVTSPEDMKRYVDWAESTED